MTDEQLNAIMMKADDDLERLKDRCHHLYDENVELKKRIDTAIECINEYKDLVGLTGTLVHNLLYILNGSEDNE